MKIEQYQPKYHDEIISFFQTVFHHSDGEEAGQALAQFVEDIQKTPAADLQGFFTLNEENKIIAGVFFTPLFFQEDLKAWILSPMAVATEYQGKGYGQSLITHSLNELKKQKIALVMTYGDPKFYGKTGFVPVTESQIKAPQKMEFPHGWLGQMLDQTSIPTLDSKPTTVEALNKPELW